MKLETALFIPPVIDWYAINDLAKNEETVDKAYDNLKKIGFTSGFAINHILQIHLSFNWKENYKNTLIGKHTDFLDVVIKGVWFVIEDRTDSVCLKMNELMISLYSWMLNDQAGEEVADKVRKALKKTCIYNSGQIEYIIHQ